MWIPRHLEAELKRRSLARPIVALWGAQQTGKTELVRRVFPAHRFVSLEQPGVAELAERDPGLFLKEQGGPLILDALEYAPGLLPHLCREAEKSRAGMGHYILTATPPYPMLQEQAAALPGQMALLRMGGLSFSELKAAGVKVSIETLFLRGGFPELYGKRELTPRDFFQSYLARYEERNFRKKGRSGCGKGSDTVLRALALRTSQFVYKTDLGKTLGVSAPTARARISVLEQSGLLALVDSWVSPPTRLLLKSPKLHLLDTGLACFLLGLQTEGELSDFPLVGALWESRVFAEMRTLLDAGREPASLLYWRDRYKEADFLLQRSGKIQLADAAWSAHPEDAGLLERIRMEFRPPPPLAVFCRTPQPYSLSKHARALRLEDVGDWLAGKNV